MKVSYVDVQLNLRLKGLGKILSIVWKLEHETRWHRTTRDSGLGENLVGRLRAGGVML